MIFVTPVERNYSVIAGNTFHDAFTIKVDGQPLDITGWKARLRGGPINLSSVTGEIVLGNAAGTVDITAAVAVVRAWGAIVVDFQFELEDGGGSVQAFYYGQFEVKPEIA